MLPFSQAGVLIEKTPAYIKIKAKLGLVAIWNEEDSFLVGLWLHIKPAMTITVLKNITYIHYIWYTVLFKTKFNYSFILTTGCQ